MIIHSLTATYGTLEEHHLQFEEGFNIIYAPNESGKSTFCQLLITMLYGLDTRQRDTKTSLADKNRFRPWSGKAMEGQLECSLNNTRYLLRRSSENGAPMATFSFVYADNRLPVEGITSNNVGVFLTGVNKQIFTACFLFSESNLILDKQEDIETRLLTLLSDEDTTYSFSQVESTLRKWQHRRSSHKNSELSKLESRTQSISEKLAQISEFWPEYILLQEQIKEIETELLELDNVSEKKHQLHHKTIQENLAKAQDDLASLTKQMDVTSHSKSKKSDHPKQKMLHAFYLFLILSFVSVFSVLTTSYDRFTIPASILFICATVWSLFKLKPQNCTLMQTENSSTQNQSSLNAQSLAKERIEFYQTQLNQPPSQSKKQASLQEALYAKQNKLAEFSGRLQELGDPSILETELQTLQAKKQRRIQEYEALQIAMKALETANHTLHAEFSPALNEKALQYFNFLTNEAYKHINFSRDFSAIVEPSHTLIQANAHQLSHGTIDQLYFSLRLALCDLLLPEHTSIPIILDDALTSFDDARAKRALQILNTLTNQRQILMFTCHTREQRMLADDPDVHMQNFREC